MPYTDLIWDFNGTLLNDVAACLNSANDLLCGHGLKRLESVTDYRALFGFPIIDYSRRMGFDFEKDSYDELAVEWVALYRKYSVGAGLFASVKPTLEKVAQKGIRQWILSATERQMLESQVCALGIHSYFEDVLGLDNIHAHSKEALGVQWRAAHPNASVLFVGDTDHDAAVARAMGADCVLLSTGHQLPATLAAANPLAVADSLEDILTVL